jgi:hypothetical protein
MTRILKENLPLKLKNMKKIYLLLTLFCLSLYGFSQENIITVSGGYSFANIEDDGGKAPGWRINGSYEFNPSQGPWAFGFAVGYIDLSTSQDMLGSGTADINMGTIPIYFAPKFLFGSEKIKGFIKGALGTQNTRFKVTTSLLEVTDNDWGFYGGGSAGININLSEKFFLNAEYELAWLSNSFYKDGLMNSAMLGIGVKF